MTMTVDPPGHTSSVEAVGVIFRVLLRCECGWTHDMGEKPTINDLLEAHYLHLIGPRDGASTVLRA